jgi:hypothetical protein
MAFQTKVTIDGVDVTNYVASYRVIDTVEDMSNAEMFFDVNILNIISLEKDQEIIISRGTISATDNTIFRGNINQIKKGEGEDVYVEALDKLWLLKRQTITISYDKDIDDEGGKVSSIASDLITRGGLTPEVEDSGSATRIDKYIIRSDNILDHLQDLANLIDYQLYYDPDTDTVKFKSKGFEVFSTTLQVGANLVKIPEWEYDYTKIANDVTLIGDKSGITSVTLSNKPENVRVFIDEELLSGGISEQDSSFDYSVDKENKKILFETATSGSGTVTYSFLRPIKIRKKNVESISKYGTYAVHKTIDTIQTTNDAEIKINEILNKFSDPLVDAKGLLVYDVFGGKANQQVNIIDSVNDENRTVNIRRYVYNFPVVVDQIDVDNEPIYEDYILHNAIIKRLERLERKNETQGDLTVQFIDLFRSISPKRRFNKIIHQQASGTGFLLNDLAFGVLGTSTLGTPFHSSGTVVKLLQGDMTYYEDLRDTQFVDSGSTDAVITTSGTSPTSASIAFSSGSVFQTSEIDVGSSLSSIRLDVGTSSGSFKYEITNDGKANWQQFSSGELVGITNSSGTGTFLRITEEDTGGTILNSINSYGEVSSPALKLTMVV